MVTVTELLIIRSMYQHALLKSSESPNSISDLYLPGFFIKGGEPLTVTPKIILLDEKLMTIRQWPLTLFFW